jgi:small subunit ribosomal protein S4
MVGKRSEYGKRLREKQRAKRYSGVLERQFRRYFRQAEPMKGLTGENLLMLLETRLDTVVRRLGFAPSQSSARQAVLHRHVTVNGRIVNIPSFNVQANDAVALQPKFRENALVKKTLEDVVKRGTIPGWLQLNAGEYTGTVLRMPSRQEISIPVQEQLIVELYSK